MVWGVAEKPIISDGSIVNDLLDEINFCAKNNRIHIEQISIGDKLTIYEPLLQQSKYNENAIIDNLIHKYGYKRPLLDLVMDQEVFKVYEKDQFAVRVDAPVRNPVADKVQRIILPISYFSKINISEEEFIGKLQNKEKYLKYAYQP